MIDRILLAWLIVVCGWSAVLAQIPPPPPRLPDGIPAVHEGYDMVVPYRRWGMWIETQKGPVTEQALVAPDTVEGRHLVGGPLFTVAFHNDSGRAASGEVRVYCTLMPVYPDPDRGDCSYLYRRADVPVSFSYGAAPNAVDVWMRENFDPALVVRNLRAAGVAPGADVWTMRQDLFAGAPSPQPMLTENRHVVRVDSRDCPAFKTAIDAVERGRLDWTVDLFAVGEDLPMPPPRPHAGRTFYTLNAWIDGGSVVLSGGPALATLLGPVIEAVWNCEQAAAASARRRS